jgi:hypothetical protein
MEEAQVDSTSIQCHEHHRLFGPSLSPSFQAQQPWKTQEMSAGRLDRRLQLDTAETTRECKSPFLLLPADSVLWVGCLRSLWEQTTGIINRLQVTHRSQQPAIKIAERWTSSRRIVPCYPTLQLKTAKTRTQNVERVGRA